jgi:hypothetical protein
LKAPFCSETVIHDSGMSIVVVGWKRGHHTSQLVASFPQYQENTNSSQDVYTLLERIFRGDLGLNVEGTNKTRYV